MGWLWGLPLAGVLPHKVVCHIKSQKALQTTQG